jgi:hypothetical protein
MYLDGSTTGDLKGPALSCVESESDRVSELETPILIYDYFSGCGGTSAGLRAAGMKPVLALDIDPEALSTYAENFPEGTAVERDVRDLSTSDLEHLFENERNSPTLFSACAPCQPFSKQNRQKKNKDDRASLLNELGRFVRRFRPELLVIENVPGLQNISKDEDGPLHQLVELLDELGYWHTTEIIQARTTVFRKTAEGLCCSPVCSGLSDFQSRRMEKVANLLKLYGRRSLTYRRSKPGNLMNGCQTTMQVRWHLRILNGSGRSRKVGGGGHGPIISSWNATKTCEGTLTYMVE